MLVSCTTVRKQERKTDRDKGKKRKVRKGGGGVEEKQRNESVCVNLGTRIFAF